MDLSQGHTPAPTVLLWRQLPPGLSYWYHFPLHTRYCCHDLRWHYINLSSLLGESSWKIRKWCPQEGERHHVWHNRNSLNLYHILWLHYSFSKWGSWETCLRFTREMLKFRFLVPTLHLMNQKLSGGREEWMGLRDLKFRNLSRFFFLYIYIHCPLKYFLSYMLIFVSFRNLLC